MRRLALSLALAVAALAIVPTALADGGPFLVVQGGQGVATRDGAFHYVAVTSGRSTLLEKLEVANGQVNYSIPLKGSWGIPTLGTGSLIGQGLAWNGRTLVLAAPPGYTSPSRFLLVDLKRLRTSGRSRSTASSPSTPSRPTGRACTSSSTHTAARGT